VEGGQKGVTYSLSHVADGETAERWIFGECFNFVCISIYARLWMKKCCGGICREEGGGLRMMSCDKGGKCQGKCHVTKVGRVKGNVTKAKRVM
jgi:hypothetical protein